MELANIPMELKERPQWLLWKYEMREKRRTKIPYSARTGKPARWQDPESWAPFGEAVWMLKDKQFDGIGFVLTSADPWTGVDIDHCLNQETGEIDAEAMEIVRALSTYTEITPSGTGLHLFCRAKLPEGRRRAGRLEMYDSDRFLTMTGELLPGGPVAIQDRQEQMNALHAATFPEAEGRPQLARAGPVTVPADDAAVIEKVIRDSHYLALWRGDYSDYSSQSEADLALAGRIGFFVGWDAATVERLFRQSGLYRQKWESDRSGTTYGHITATKACSGVRQAYQWKSNGAAPPPNGGTSVAFVASVAVARHDPQPPVKLEPEALTGLPGAVVEAISPHTEAHPAAVLASFLVGSGCVLGRHRYVYRDGARHCPNEFVCLVGQSAVGRKGTATRRTDEIFSYTVGSDYTKSLYMRGTEGGGRGRRDPYGTILSFVA